MCAVWNAHAPVFHQFLPVHIRFIKSSPLPSVASQESAEPAESMIVTVAFGSTLQQTSTASGAELQ